MENYLKPVKRGFICYTRSNYRIKELVYKEKDFSYAKDIVNEIFNVILHGYFPKKTKSRIRCIDCCYKNICVWKLIFDIFISIIKLDPFIYEGNNKVLKNIQFYSALKNDRYF